MWFDEPRIQLTLEKIMEKLGKINADFPTGSFFAFLFLEIGTFNFAQKKEF